MVKKSLFLLAFIMAIALAGCSDDDNNDVNVPLDDEILASYEEYNDSIVKLIYPNTWTLSYPEYAVVQFFAPTVNQVGGTDNCVLGNYTASGETLMDAVSELLDLMLDSPEPTIEFLTINGISSARISGSIQIFNVIIPMQTQLMEKESTVHSLICVGSSFDEEMKTMIDSMVLL